MEKFGHSATRFTLSWTTASKTPTAASTTVSHLASISACHQDAMVALTHPRLPFATTSPISRCTVPGALLPIPTGATLTAFACSGRSSTGRQFTGALQALMSWVRRPPALKAAIRGDVRSFLLAHPPLVLSRSAPLPGPQGRLTAEVAHKAFATASPVACACLAIESRASEDANDMRLSRGCQGTSGGTRQSAPSRTRACVCHCVSRGVCMFSDRVSRMRRCERYAIVEGPPGHVAWHVAVCAVVNSCLRVPLSVISC